MLNIKKLEKRLRELVHESEKGSDIELRHAVYQFKLLNHALKKGWQVWAECEKSPSGNLDSGKHWYQIYFLGLDDNGNPVKRHFWVIDLMDKNPSRYCRGYGFSSGAIGMSRLLDATDHIFTILKDCGGEYKQL